MSNTWNRRDFLSASLSATALCSANSLFGADDAKAGPYADAIFVAGEPKMPDPKSFCLAVLPDTQFYSESYPETFLKQTRWIAENAKSRNIQAVLQLGDITNRNSIMEWERAQTAMNVLDGTLPYFLSIGNHDCSNGGAFRDRTTHFNKYFPLDKFRARPHFGGVYDREPEQYQNNYNLLTVGDREFLILALEMAPRADVIRWANEVVDKYPQREAILITHGYLFHDDTRYDLEKYGDKQSSNPRTYGATKGTDAADGEMMWKNLVSKHPNFILTLNGHVVHDGLGRLVSSDNAGREVPQVLVNFQMKPKGGDGWLRLLEFTSDGQLRAIDYSPTRNECNVSEQNQFSLTLPKVA